MTLIQKIPPTMRFMKMIANCRIFVFHGQKSRTFEPAHPNAAFSGRAKNNVTIWPPRHLHNGEICDFFRQYIRAIYKAKQLVGNNHNNTDEQVATNPMT